MTLDEMERLAFNITEGALAGSDSTIRAVAADRMARALITVLPVVGAAEAWGETEALDLTFGPFASDHLASIDRLKRTLDALRATLRGGG